MSHTCDPAARDDLVRRLARAEGHLAAVRRMVERGEPCGAVLAQLAAVQGALSAVAGHLLTAHLAVCLDEHDPGRRADALPGLRAAIRSVVR